MLNMKTKPVVLGLTVLLTLLIVGAAPMYAAELNFFTGKITTMNGDIITLNGYKTFEPANERAKVPKWAKQGTEVKVGYYNQNKINYYHEIGRPGRALEIEKESWRRDKADD